MTPDLVLHHVTNNSSSNLENEDDADQERKLNIVCRELLTVINGELWYME